MSTICTQCLGKCATIGIEALIDLNVNTQTFQPNNGARQGAIPCSQCNGRGYYN